MFMDCGVDKNNWTANNVEREFNSDGIQVHGNDFHCEKFRRCFFGAHLVSLLIFMTEI
jgi:hypothetical protein